MGTCSSTPMVTAAHPAQKAKALTGSAKSDAFRGKSSSPDRERPMWFFTLIGEDSRGSYGYGKTADYSCAPDWTAVGMYSLTRLMNQSRDPQTRSVPADT